MMSSSSRLLASIEAFQRHWRPLRIDGLADAECEAILAALLKKIDFAR